MGPLEKMQDGRHFQDGRYLLINISMNDIHFYRAMLCIRGTSHGPVSVCLSQAGVLLKRQNVESHRQHHTIPQQGV